MEEVAFEIDSEERLRFEWKKWGECQSQGTGLVKRWIETVATNGKTQKRNQRFIQEIGNTVLPQSHFTFQGQWQE